MEGSLDSTTMTALAVTLTILAGAWAFVSWRRSGLAAGLKGLALVLVPPALLLTGILRLLVGIVDDVAAWATRLVFSPVVWGGIVLAGVAVVLYVVGGMLASRGIGVRGRAAQKAVRRGERVKGRAPVAGAAATPGGARSEPQQGRPAKGTQPAAQDDDMDEIEAILRKHGI